MKIKNIVLLIFLAILTLGCTKEVKKAALSKDEVKVKVEQLLSADELEFKNEKILTVENNEDHLLLIDGNEYIYIDLTKEKAIVYKLQTKGLISVQIVEIMDDGYVVGHDGHFDFIEGKLPANKKIGDFIDIIDPHIKKDSLKDKNEKEETKVSVNETKNNKNIKNDSINKKNVDTISVKYTENKEKKKEEPVILNNDDNYVFNIKDVVRETENGYIVKHDDHYHFIYKKNTAKQNSQKNIENTKKYAKEIEYIANLNGIKKEEIKIEGDLLIYPHEDHEHVIEISKIVIPKISNDPEKDFEEELVALSKLTNTPIDNIIIKDRYMKIIHGDHTHDYKIKSPGWIDYLKNKIPNISTEYIKGSLDRNLVKNEANKVLDKAKVIYKNNNKQLRRIERTINNFIDSLAWGDTSTEGYLNALKKFDAEYVSKTEANDPKIPTETFSYKEIINKINLIKNNLDINDKDYHKKLKQINDLEVDASYKIKTEEELSILLKQFEDGLKENISPTKTLFDEKYDEVHKLIKTLDENNNLKLKIYLLNKLNEIEPAEENISKLEELKAELSNTKPEENQLQDLINYITANKDDPRLTEEERQQLENILSHHETATINTLNEAKALIKSSFKRFEEEENKYSSRATNVINDALNQVNSLNDETVKTGFIEELNKVKKQLNDKNVTKETVYRKSVTILESIKSALIDQSSALTENLDGSENSVEENTPTEDNTTLDLNLANEIVSFINNNKRNMVDNSEKVSLLNTFYELEEKLITNTLKNSDIETLKVLKAKAEELIAQNTNPSANNNDFGGW